MFQYRVKKNEAFTMVEMLLVVALLGGIFAFVGPRIIRQIRKAGESKVNLRMIGIHDGLTEFKIENDRYPNQKEGLAVVGLTEKDIEDFEYNSPPKRYPKKFKKYELIYVGGDVEAPIIGGDGKNLKPADAKALSE